MKKYVIKNCPAILRMFKACDDNRTTCDNPQLCQDITDCVLKQICAACRDIVKAGFVQNRYGVMEAKFEGYGLAVSILEKLEIEEV